MYELNVNALFILMVHLVPSDIKQSEPYIRLE